MSDTEHLAIGLLEAAQSQKHVTVNEALVLLDALLHLAVISMTLAAPPASPAAGDRYLVAASPSGEWAGHAGDIAFYQDGAWRFATPRGGWRLWSLADGKLHAFDGTAWRDIAALSELQDMDLLGVNATADAANRFSVSSANVLLRHEGASLRLKLNKQAAGDTAAIVLQDNFSGRAELGLAGDDDFHLKVSADGSAWTEAMVIDRTSGAMSLPAGSLALPAASAPALPAAGKLAAFARDVGGRIMLSQRAPVGRATPLQMFLGQRRVSHWMAAGGSLAVSHNGSGASVATGTATVRLPSSARLFTSMRRLGYVSAAAAGSSCGLLSHDAPVFWRGNATALGGFHAIFTFGVSDPATVANARMFVGLSSLAGAIGNIEPSSLTDCIGVGCDAGETTLRIMSNDGTGSATRSDLGANFPSQTLSVDWYELILFAAPNAASLSWKLTRLNSNHVAEGSLAADLPDTDVFLAPQLWRNNGTTALAVGIDIGAIYIETDN